jgi:uncharacterized repeat protein (TIGR01451 family)
MLSRNLFLRFGMLSLLAGVLASSFYLSSAASTSGMRSLAPKPVAQQAAGPVVPAAVAQRTTAFRAGTFAPLSPLPPAGVSLTTYAGDCTTPKTVFNVQDADKTVCAKVTGAPASWRILWSNANFVTVQNVPVGTGTSTFTLTSTSSLGDWRVILFEPFGGDVQAVTSFTVVDAANPTADLSVTKGLVSGSATAGGQLIFAIQVANSGPSAATAVQLSDSVPANTTFVSFGQLDGPTFACLNPDGGSNTGSSVCTIGSLNRGEEATFLATYQVAAAATGTLSNTVSVSTTVTDPKPDNNSSTSEIDITPAACQLSTPSNINVSADSGQAGAVVTYATPTTSGDCGQVSTGENGETIPVVSCNPASGTFFPVGTTSVICVAQAGTAVSFEVTVDNPGGLSISLNGASSVTVECGTDFTDPGASAVNGTGQSVPVVTTYSGGFNPDAPAVGTYTATYSATEDPNSVSTTRTIVVADSEAPSITVHGANPYKIQQGTCSPFSDPGASAVDSCAGPKAVTSSISGPGGATSVDTNVAGTYTVTYNSTDGTHAATATRTVLVGTFSEDEVDQPATSNLPPTLTLNGDDQVSIECGTPFSDPGATATVCGNPIAVTTSGTVDIHTPGVYSITYSATANGQTSQATRTVTVEADNTAPTIQVLGANPMTVECHTTFTDPGATAHDACAGDFPATASGTVDANTVGSYTITYNATDPSGHPATAATRTVNVVDTTAPTVTAPANVTVNTGSGASSCSTTVSDATLGSGSANDACQGALAVTRTGVPAGNVFPVGQTTVTYSATDASGNTGSATQTVTVIDNTPPTISCPANITVYLPLNTTATSMVVNYTAPVGTDNCAGATTTQTGGLASGATVPVGTTTNTFRVTDAAGNYTDCSFTVTVLYDFTGFFAPIDNLPIVNSMKAGQAAPIKFSLSGNKGLNIFAAGSPSSIQISCQNGDPVAPVEETLTAGSSSLSYSATSDQYIYVWKTEGSWKNTCRQLTVKLNDGSEHFAKFTFK